MGGDFDLANPEHSKLLTEALQELGYCADTMALLLEATGERSRDDHNETYDGLSGS